MVSSRLVSTLTELAELRTTLITINATASYPPSGYVRARAFVVLAHGVLEDYLEGITIEVVDAAYNKFAADDKPRVALLTLMQFTGGEEPPVAAPGGPWMLREKLKNGRETLRAWTTNNHGIKEKHVLRLLLPAGIKQSDMTSAWLQAMTDLGELRGRVAHHGSSFKAQTPVTPNDALQQLEAVLPTLCRLDAKLVVLRDQ